MTPFTFKYLSCQCIPLLNLHLLLVQDIQTYTFNTSTRMCLNVTFTSPVAHLGQLSAFTSVHKSITSEIRWLDVTRTNPSGLPSWSHYRDRHSHAHVAETHTHTLLPPPFYLRVSCCSCASWCRRLRAFSCLRWSFHDFEATLRANSLCLSSFSLCREIKFEKDAGRKGRECADGRA